MKPAMPHDTSAPLDHRFLGDGGEMGALIRAYDWSSSTIGAPATWPQSLRTAVRLMLTSRHPMFIWWGPNLIQFYNDAYRDTMGPERHPSALGDRGRDCWAEIWPIIGPQIELVMRGEGSTWNEHQLVPVTRHGALQEVWWTYGYSPIDDGESVGGVLVVCNDVTKEHEAREALAAANSKLLSDVDRLREMFGQAPGFIAAMTGPDHVFEFTNTAYDRLVGSRGLVGNAVREALPDLHGQGFFELLDRVYASGEPHVGAAVPLSVERQASLGPEQLFVDFVYQPMRNARGAVTGIFVEGYDVTARILAEKRQILLTHEMNHRVKNTLATVQALAMLTGKSSKTVEDFKRRFADRISAMAKTQDLLLRGHAAPLLVGEVLEAELAPYLDAGDQVALTCQAIFIAPEAAVNLGLLTHELLTNAAKYGALSTPQGRLAVRCELGTDGAAVLTWREQVQRVAPARAGGGFGGKLIERLAQALGGRADIHLKASGLEAVITFDPASVA